MKSPCAARARVHRDVLGRRDGTQNARGLVWQRIQFTRAVCSGGFGARGTGPLYSLVLIVDLDLASGYVIVLGTGHIPTLSEGGPPIRKKADLQY